VQRLQVQPIIRLDWNKAHGWPLDGFGNRLGVEIIVLVRFAKVRRLFQAAGYLGWQEVRYGDFDAWYRPE
jgi:Na+-transporting NADH:ubiquinone oxidoreductase subunit NqrD